MYMCSTRFWQVEYKDTYKNSNTIPHKVLADRIAQRDPGNKLKAGDRVSYVYIETNDNKKKLQVDFIEDPEYVKWLDPDPEVAAYPRKSDTVRSPYATT